MSHTASVGTLFREGRLEEAIAAATARVRAEPAAAGHRMVLAELLLFAGNLARADVLLDAAGTIDPSLGIAAAEFRQLLRAAEARAQLMADGRVPDFLDAPTAAQREALAVVVALRAGDLTEAATHAAAAEAARPHVGFAMDGRRFDDLRDADDLIGGSLEVLTPTGKYLWVPFERVAMLTLHPPERPRDLYWRHATLAVTDGPDGDVYVPALYVGDGTALDPALRLGRATDWRNLADGLTCGVGQRMFLAGEEGLGVMEITTLTRVA